MSRQPGISTYSGAHANTRRRRGPASARLCPCGEQAREWALIHGAPGTRASAEGQAFSIDPADYFPMCFRCHRLYDKALITRCPQGHQYTGENLLIDSGKRKCKTCVYERNSRRQRERGLTREQRDRKNELQRKWRARQNPEATS